MLIERKTLYDPRVHSHNIPQCHAIHLCTTRETGKRTLQTVTSIEWTTMDTRCKRALGIQYKHESKEDITGFISKPVARPEYGVIYQHKGMLLQNLHCRYLYILIKLPHLLDLEQ